MLFDHFLRFSPADDVASIVGKFAALMCTVLIIVGIVSGLAYVICYILYRSWSQNHPGGDARKCRFCFPHNPDDNLKCIYVHNFASHPGHQQGSFQEAACVIAQSSVNGNNLVVNKPSAEKEYLPLTKSKQGEITVAASPVIGLSEAPPSQLLNKVNSN
ncbi:hypothetical protein Ocin01_09881 [Orchesella cincta]|uniref:Uncharacterized protein n=1 Tax=Orchesella cincta TaxID=48709 RepID=A0A1D2MUL4_ORCCI|nr:hypothetical protein Ocin01_09881 [Orchesella cincta]